MREEEEERMREEEEERMREEEEQRMREGKELMPIPTIMTMIVLNNNKESGKNANDAVWRKKSDVGN